MKNRVFSLAILGVLGLASLRGDSLWLGNDFSGGAAGTVLEMSTAGVLLQTVTVGSVIGVAADLTTNTLFLNKGGITVERRDLTTMAVTGSFSLPATSEDLAFDGSTLWAGNFGGSALQQVDPFTGAPLGGFPIGFTPLGLAFDGSGFWVSEFAASSAVRRFDTAGNLVFSFLPTSLAGTFAGGLAWDTSDGTLWIGSFNSVHHYTAAGGFIGSFATPDSRFVDGLEYVPSSAAVPEPAFFGILGFGMAMLFVARQKAKSKSLNHSTD